MPNPTPVIDIMSYEPWYQAQSPSKSDVINSVNKSEFISNLNKEEIQNMKILN